MKSLGLFNSIFSDIPCDNYFVVALGPCDTFFVGVIQSFELRRIRNKTGV